MNRFLVMAGSSICALWLFVTFMTKGLAPKIVLFFDTITLHAFFFEAAKMRNGFYYDVPNSETPTLAFFVVFTLIFIIYAVTIKRLETAQTDNNSVLIIVFFAVAMRLFTFWGEMIHENDIYRYLWDAKQAKAGINPYKYAPSDLFMYEYGHTQDYYDEDHEVTLQARAMAGDDKRNLHKLLKLRDSHTTAYNRIGHWQVPTVYPPVAELLFLVPALIKEDSLLVMKLFFVLFDLAAIGVIIKLLKLLNMRPVMSLVYAWSPLVVMQLSNSGHYDSIPIFFTVLGVYLVLASKRAAGTAVLALASLSKFFSGVLLPVLLKPLRLQYLNIFIFLVVLFYGPYWLWDQTGTGVFSGLGAYTREWSYNPSIYALVYNAVRLVYPPLVESLMPTKLITGFLYLSALVLIIRQKAKNDLEIVHQCFLAIALLFLCSPVGDPWYFCWSIPFLCVFRYRSWLLLSGLLVFSYINFHKEFAVAGERIWNLPVVSLIIYVPFFILLFAEIVKRRFHRKKI